MVVSIQWGIPCTTAALAYHGKEIRYTFFELLVHNPIYDRIDSTVKIEKCCKYFYQIKSYSSTRTTKIIPKPPDGCRCCQQCESDNDNNKNANDANIFAFTKILGGLVLMSGDSCGTAMNNQADGEVAIRQNRQRDYISECEEDDGIDLLCCRSRVYIIAVRSMYIDIIHVWCISDKSN